MPALCAYPVTLLGFLRTDAKEAPPPACPLSLRIFLNFNVVQITPGVVAKYPPQPQWEIRCQKNNHFLPKDTKKTGYINPRAMPWPPTCKGLQA